jgi:CO/xanthine dehydrogenase FAD-binding subunit
MKPARFSYTDPTALDDVTALLAQLGAEAKLLAGGQSLMPVLNMRLSRTDYLIDLNRVSELDYVEGADGVVKIGALSRHDGLFNAGLIVQACPLLFKAIPHIGHTAIRYRGTAGGSLVHADPSAELPAVMCALDAELTLTSSKGKRVVPASEFFLTYFTTAIAPEEVLTELSVPVAPRHAGSAVVELARRHGDFAIAGVAAMLTASEGRVDAARLCAFGVDEVPRRLTEVERMVAGEMLSPELLAEAAECATSLVEPETDMHASASYRREMTGVLTRRALEEAFDDSSTSRGAD